MIELKLKLVELQKEINNMYSHYEYLSSINNEDEILCNPSMDITKINSLMSQINKMIE